MIHGASIESSWPPWLALYVITPIWSESSSTSGVESQIFVVIIAQRDIDFGMRLEILDCAPMSRAAMYEMVRDVKTVYLSSKLECLGDRDIRKG